MERNLERAKYALSALSEALDEYDSVQDSLQELASYYGSATWKQDFADDEQGKLPHTLKRGILSEDVLWDVLEDNRTLKERLATHSLLSK